LPSPTGNANCFETGISYGSTVVGATTLELRHDKSNAVSINTKEIFIIAIRFGYSAMELFR